VTLISIVICLFSERFLSELFTFRNYTWFEKFAASVGQLTKHLSIKTVVILIVLPVPLLIAFIDYYFINNSIIQFLFATTILLLSMGPKQFYELAKEFCQTFKKGELDIAQWIASKILDRDLSPEEKSNLANTVVHCLFIIANDRILAPIFWFIILGPMGAVFFRLSSELRYLCEKNERIRGLQVGANLLHAIMNWIPSRLTAFGYAAMGNFVSAMGKCKNGENLFEKLSLDNNRRLLYTAGTGALTLSNDAKTFNHHDVYQTLSLIRRTYALTLGTIALLTLGGWLI